MKKNVTLPEVSAESVRNAVAKLNEYRALNAGTLESLKKAIANAVKTLTEAKTDDAKAIAKDKALSAVADYNAAAALLTVKNLNALPDALEKYLTTSEAGSYDSAKLSRGSVTYEPAYVTASEWNAKNGALRALYELAATDPTEKAPEKSLFFPVVVPASLEFQGALEVLQVLCVRTLEFTNAAPLRATNAAAKPTNADLLGQVNKVAALVTGKDEDLYSWASRAVLTFSATYRAKKRIVKGASDADFINLIFDIIRQKRMKVDKMAFTSKASAFREAK